ncbi:neuroserpin-like [Toxorhynchites rutilus septentrionalis]|uniref:neuroserpin-like n=1 Tax=Toxorhynchites rutilus septentrionalis TaxID=329112 RepID=UPI00247A4219|nr:neuroserpin-like [Toxorhynchites rutilus septentrionalis]
MSTLSKLSISDILKKMHTKEVELSLPKFRIEFNMDLKEIVEKLGMAGIFSDSADFSELLVQKDPLNVSKFVHKAFIEVNEEGTEAAAAGGLWFQNSCAPQRVKLTVDRPFYFVMFDRRNKVSVFNGRMQNPIAV